MESITFILASYEDDDYENDDLDKLPVKPKTTATLEIAETKSSKLLF